MLICATVIAASAVGVGVAHWRQAVARTRDWTGFEVNGLHYARTSEAWLSNMDQHREALLPVLAETYGADQVARWWVYWRVFFMACAELWGFKNGEEWFVSHYLFSKTK